VRTRIHQRDVRQIQGAPSRPTRSRRTSAITSAANVPTDERAGLPEYQGIGPGTRCSRPKDTPKEIVPKLSPRASTRLSTTTPPGKRLLELGKRFYQSQGPARGRDGGMPAAPGETEMPRDAVIKGLPGPGKDLLRPGKKKKKINGLIEADGRQTTFVL